MTIAASRTDRKTLSGIRAVLKAANYALRRVPLSRTQIAGRLSMLDSDLITIAAVRGLVLRVRGGALWITQHKDTQDHVVRAGEAFLADRAGPMVIQPLGNVELAVEWPSRGTDRLSPGLEQFELAS